MNPSSIPRQARKINRGRLSGHSWLILLPGALLIASLWLYVHFQIQYDYDRTIAESSQETMNLTKAFEEHVRRVVTDADHDLSRLKLAVERGRLSSPDFVANITPKTGDPSRNLIAVFNEKGHVVASFSQDDHGLNRSELESVLVQCDNSSSDLVVGRLIIGPATGKATIPLGRRVSKPDGSFGGIVFIGLKADYFLDFYNKIDLGQDQLITLTGMDGFLRARQSNGKVNFGADMRQGALWKENIQTGGTDGTFITNAISDGISRINSYRILPEYPLVVVVGKATQGVMAPFERRRQGYITGASMASLFIFGFCFVLINRNENARRLTGVVQQERDRLSSLINSIGDEVWFTDTKEQFTRANPSAAGEAFRADVLQADGSFRTHENLPTLRALQGEVIRNEQEIIRIPETGEWRYREISANPVRDADGNIIGSVSVVRDITDRKQAERELASLCQKLEVVSNAKSGFLANMSHELRTPLNAIIGFSEVLQDKLFGPLNTKQEKYVDNILVSAQHLLSLVIDILDMSNAESGKMELERDRINIEEICQGSVALFRDKATRRQVQLNFIPDATIKGATMVADGRRLKQILYNLIDNGIKFNKPGGSVSVTAKKINGGANPSAIQIVVEDTGIGISSESMAMLFKPFAQISMNPAEPTEGTGLGLALTKSLVELHGGEIQVESKYGKGSRFIVLIPIHREQA